MAGPESAPAPSPVSSAERVFGARADRAAVLHAVGVVEWVRKRHDEARDALHETLVLCEQLLGERPADAPLRTILADTHRTLGSMDWDARRLHQAKAHLDAAVATAPDDLEVRLIRGRILVEFGHDIEARDDIVRVLASAPLSPAAFRMAAAVHARLAPWDTAAETLATLLERDPGDHWNWCVSAALRARAGDTDRYRRLCRRMLDRFGGSQDPVVAARTAKYCLLLPLPGPEQDDASQLAEQAVGGATGTLGRWVGAVEGLADYRRGRFADAVAAIDKSQAADSDGDWDLRVFAGCVRSMALMRLRSRDEARSVVMKASGLYRSNVQPATALDPGASWADLLTCEVLLHEAEALVVYDPAFPANPFAR